MTSQRDRAPSKTNTSRHRHSHWRRKGTSEKINTEPSPDLWSSQVRSVTNKGQRYNDRSSSQAGAPLPVNSLMRVPWGEGRGETCSRAQEIHGDGDKSRESGLPGLYSFSANSGGTITAPYDTKHGRRVAEQTLPVCGPSSHFTGIVDGSDNPVLSHISEEQAWSVG